MSRFEDTHWKRLFLELVESEGRYVNDLTVIVDESIKPHAKAEIFGNVSELLEIHKVLVAKLRETAKEKTIEKAEERLSVEIMFKYSATSFLCTDRQCRAFSKL